jgi:hypothetical protein
MASIVFAIGAIPFCITQNQKATVEVRVHLGNARRASPFQEDYLSIRILPMFSRYSLALVVFFGISPFLGNGAAAQPPSPGALVVVPISLMASGQKGGPFSPPSFQYRLSATTGTVDYSIETPSWVTANPSNGTVDARGVLVTLTITETAQSFEPGAYTPPVKFKNMTSGRGSTSRVIRLVVLAPKTTTTGVGVSNNSHLDYLTDSRGEVLVDGHGARLLAR